MGVALYAQIGGCCTLCQQGSDGVGGGGVPTFVNQYYSFNERLPMFALMR